MVLKWQIYSSYTKWNLKNKETKGADLIQFAVHNGGEKLDSYAGNHEFYTRNGFEPICCISFNEDYAPPDWRKGRDNPEDIIFFKYTGNKFKGLPDDLKNEFETFKKNTPAQDYDVAYKARDKELKK